MRPKVLNWFGVPFRVQRRSALPEQLRVRVARPFQFGGRIVQPGEEFELPAARAMALQAAGKVSTL